MAPGPLPNSAKRRRNAPTIPSTELPAKGRTGRTPKCPYDLAKAGSKWWKWAWGLPQATRWDAGALYVVARRAQLEDDLAALDLVDDFNVAELLDVEEDELVERLQWMISRLKASAGGRTSLMREMRELDNRLGLNPKAMADLRWSIAGTNVEKPEAAKPAQVRRLRAVDSRRSA